MFNKGTLTAAGEDILLRYFYGFLLNILASPQYPSVQNFSKTLEVPALKIFAPRLNSTIPARPSTFSFAAYAKKHPSKNPKCDLHSNRTGLHQYITELIF